MMTIVQLIWQFHRQLMEEMITHATVMKSIKTISISNFKLLEFDVTSLVLASVSVLFIKKEPK